MELRRVKQCRECSGVKPINSFYQCKAMSDGYSNTCKDCVKHNVRENRRLKIEHYRKYDRERSMLPKRVAARKEYTQTADGKLAHKVANRWYRKMHPDHYKAQNAVNNAIRDGKLKRQPCEVCGAKAHAHHDDYSKPLMVRWLCPLHHKETHKQISLPMAA